MGGVFLEVHDLRKSFGGVKALDGVSLALREGEIHCLAGENGCGKSTLIKIISGFYKRDEGEILIGGRKIEAHSPKLAIDLGIQVVYQDLSLFPNLTVAENILFSDQLERKRKLVNWRFIVCEAAAALEKLHVDIDPSDRVGSLPLAKKQLVAIAKALFHEAKLVVLDEPTASLTQKEIDVLFSVIAELKDRGVAILLVSHKLREVIKASQYLTIMRNGQIVTQGNTSDFTEKTISYHMTGRILQGRSEIVKVDRSAAPALRVRDLGKNGCFSGISFDLWPGEILGITGLLGSGRTDVAKAIVGLDSYDSGELIVSGKSVRISSIEDAIANGIGYVPEDRVSEALFHDQSVTRNMMASSLRFYVKDLLGTLDFGKARSMVDGASSQFNIVMHDKDVAIKSLSGGNAQKVVLARWLLANANILVLNGPTVGVDVGSKFEIYLKLQELSRRGLSLVIISDDVPELVQNCHRVIVLHKGAVECELNEEGISEDAIYNLLSSLT